jgi:hypothetical protein
MVSTVPARAQPPARAAQKGAGESEPAFETVWVTDILKVRDGPDFRANLIAQVEAGRQIAFAPQAEARGWIPVRLADGRTGYARSSQLPTAESFPERAMASARREFARFPSSERDPPRSRKAVLLRAYETLKTDIQTDRVRSGRHEGRINPYWSLNVESKALAVCVSWSVSDPDRLDGQNWAFHTRDTFDRWTVRARALEQCNAGKGRRSCTCTLLDVNGQNALETPPGWVERVLRVARQ